jgi:D-3-phosphoglycerate dehydrogenase / 2-oxoglutarate reductase
MSPFTLAVLEDDEVPMRWAIERLESEGVRVVVESARTEADVLRVGADADVLLIVIAPITAAVLEGLPRCRAVIKAGVGVDTIDIEAATRLGVAVANVGNYCADDVAEHALSLALALVRRLPLADSQVRAGQWDRTAVAPVHRFSSLTLGVIGCGAIGSSLAKRWLGLGGRVVAFDPYNEPPAGVEAAESLSALLPQAQVLSLHTGLTPETRGMIGAEQLAMLPEGAILVNASRGEVVDSAAVVAALESGQLGGAGLDVWDPEPIPADSPLLSLSDVSNILVTAHYAGYSEESFDDLRGRIVEQVLDVRDGRVPRRVLNGVAALRAVE